MRANPIPETPDQTNPDSGGVAEERLLETRVQKAANLRARGIDPYPARFKPTVTSIRAVARLEAREAKLGEGAKTRSVTIAGRVMARRGMGKAAFLDIKDALPADSLGFIPSDFNSALDILESEIDSAGGS